MACSLLSSATISPLCWRVWGGGPGGTGVGAGGEEGIGSAGASAGVSEAKINGALLVGHPGFP